MGASHRGGAEVFEWVLQARAREGGGGMSERATPETDQSAESAGEFYHGAQVVLVVFARRLERERDEARELARELLDALENCREDSVELLGEWSWKRGTIPRNDAAVEELEGRISVADSVIAKAKEVLP